MNSDIENLKKLRSFHNGSYAKSIDLAIKALEEKVDPRNEPHYDDCDYCKYNECSSHDYPCNECHETYEYISKWEKP